MILRNTSIYLDEANLDFYEKLEFFHEQLVDKMLMCGVADNGADLEEIPFSKTSGHPYEFYQALVFVAKRLRNNFSVRLITQKRLELECLFFDFSPPNYAPQVYMIQNVMDWTNKNNFSCQFWELREGLSVDLIKKFWR